MNQQSLELYLHIPFCVRKCQYCDFLSFGMDERKNLDTLCGLGMDQPVPDAYIEALCREIQWYGNQEEFKNRPVVSIFLGGGTPSLMSQKQITKVMSALCEHFLIQNDAEITMEANPGTLTLEKLKTMHACRINRLSMGLQSTAENELKILGRIHSYEDFFQCFAWAREAGFENINVDLITAVPEQTTVSYKKTLEQVLALAPEHISAYSLIIEPGTPFEIMEEEEKLNIPDEDEEREMYHLTRTLLSAHGYSRYEISNYAKSGCECRHNIGYWQRVDYLGLGLGSSSLIGKRRFSNTQDLNIYIEGKHDSEEWYSYTEELSVQSEMEEFMFLGLRMIEGVSIEEFYKTFKADIMSVYGDVIRKNVSLGLLEQNEERIWLTERGLDLANAVMSDFIL